jgi:hypothetical protein
MVGRSGHDNLSPDDGPSRASDSPSVPRGLAWVGLAACRLHQWGVEWRSPSHFRATNWNGGKEAKGNLPVAAAQQSSHHLFGCSSFWQQTDWLVAGRQAWHITWTWASFSSVLPKEGIVLTLTDCFLACLARGQRSRAVSSFYYYIRPSAAQIWAKRREVKKNGGSSSSHRPKKDILSSSLNKCHLCFSKDIFD